ncbi:MAG TPA: hypothetical protein VHB68_12105 [Steroidobacteraceae bacterium]|nr:hypothetical protein [Steroidobacteraceae bacterium]
MLAGVPRWLHSRPFLLAGALSAGNLLRRNRALLPVAGVAFLGASVLLTLPVVGGFLEVLAQYPVAPFAFIAVAAAVATGRRRSSVVASLVSSWLAPLAAPSSFVLRMIWPALVQLLSLLWVILVPLAAGSLRGAAALTVLSASGVAFIAGSVAGWFTPRGAAASAPDFHYVAVRKARRSWAQAPRLVPLSYWAVGRARAFIKPRFTAKALLLVLMALPMGIRGEQAIAVAAGAGVVLYVGALTVAAVRVAGEAARWLAPTTLGYLRFTVALGYRALLALLWTCGWVIFLSYAVGLPGALSRGVRFAGLALAEFLVVLTGACWMARK